MINLCNLTPFQALVLVGALQQFEQEIEALLEGPNHVEEDRADLNTLLTAYQEAEEARLLKAALLERYNLTDNK